MSQCGKECIKQSRENKQNDSLYVFLCPLNANFIITTERAAQTIVQCWERKLKIGPGNT